MTLWSSIAEHLAANHADLSYDASGVTGQIFVATMPSVPDSVTDVHVAVMPYGGAEETTAQPTDLPLVQLLVRGPRFDPRPALAMWADLYALFAGMTSTEIGTSDPVHVHMCTPLQSGPVAIGKDANDRHEFTLNLQFRVHAPSTHRPAISA